jgi:surface antigen
VASILAAPAAAETKHKRWLPNHEQATGPGNVEQGGRQVNHRYDGHDRGKPPVWLHRPGEKGRKREHQARNYPQYPPGHGERDRRHDGRHNPPPPKYADRDYRHGDGDRNKHKSKKRYYGGHDHDYGQHRRKPRYTRHNYHYSFYYTRAYPRVIYYPVPYHTHGYGQTHGYHEQESRSAACGGGYSDGGRYVMGGSHQPGGTILGGIVGAAIGSQIGGGKGRLAAVGVGTLIGALVGRDIGRTMDDADRGYATGSFGHAMEYAPTCSTITWNNPRSGSNGAVTPTHTYEPEPGRYCREFQQEVVIGGQIQDAYGTACRQPDGSWEIVTE